MSRTKCDIDMLLSVVAVSLVSLNFQLFELKENFNLKIVKTALIYFSQ